MPFFSYTSAQESQTTCESNPPVCSATPQSMNLYLEFQSDVTGLLKTNNFETATVAISQWEGGIFTNKLLELTGVQNFDDSLAGQALKTFYITSARSATALITSAFLFELSALSTLSDNSVWLTILLHDRPIIRDWAKLLDIERNLNQSAYYLGKAWDIAKTITKTKQLRKILKTYEEKGLLQWSDSFPSSIRYMELISNLVSLNLTAKAFLAYGSTKPLENWKFKESSITLNKKRIEQLKTDYQCTRRNAGFKCNTSRSLLSKDLKILTNSTKEQGKWSRTLIKQSRKNLAQALGTFPKGTVANLQGKSSDAYLTEREKILLRNIYGLDTTRMTKNEAVSIISFSKTSKNQRKEANKGLQTTRKTVQHAWNRIRKAIKDTGKNIGTTVTSIIKNIRWEADNPDPNTLSQPRAEKFDNALRKNLEVLTILKLQADTISDNSSNISLTQQFWELSVITQELLDTVGNKEKNLRKTLNNLCNYQCTNKGNTTCYIQ